MTSDWPLWRVGLGMGPALDGVALNGLGEVRPSAEEGGSAERGVVDEDVGAVEAESVEAECGVYGVYGEALE